LQSIPVASCQQVKNNWATIVVVIFDTQNYTPIKNKCQYIFAVFQKKIKIFLVACFCSVYAF